MFFLFFNLLMWYTTFIHLLILKNSCIPGINSTGSWGVFFFNVLLDSVCKYFVENFCVCVHQQNWYIISFFVCDIFAFGMMVTAYNELASVSPSAIFWKSFRRIAVNSWLNA